MSAIPARQRNSSKRLLTTATSTTPVTTKPIGRSGRVGSFQLIAAPVRPLVEPCHTMKTASPERERTEIHTAERGNVRENSSRQRGRSARARHTTPTAGVPHASPKPIGERDSPIATVTLERGPSSTANCRPAMSKSATTTPNTTTREVGAARYAATTPDSVRAAIGSRPGQRSATGTDSSSRDRTPKSSSPSSDRRGRRQHENPFGRCPSGTARSR